MSAISLFEEKQLFCLIQPTPSRKPEPFKHWLSKDGYERLEEIETLELTARRTHDGPDRTSWPGPVNSHLFIETKHAVSIRALRVKGENHVDPGCASRGISVRLPSIENPIDGVFRTSKITVASPA